MTNKYATKCGNCLHWNMCNTIQVNNTQFAYHCEKNNNYSFAHSECGQFDALVPFTIKVQPQHEPETLRALGANK